MFDIEDAPKTPFPRATRDHSQLLSLIPWDQFKVGKAIYIPYTSLNYFPSKADALAYLRPTFHQRGLKLGLRFSIVDAPERNAIQASCVESRNRVKTKRELKEEALEKEAIENETRADRYNRAQHYVDTYMSREHPCYKREVEIAFNEYESKVRNPVLIPISVVDRNGNTISNVSFDKSIYHEPATQTDHTHGVGNFSPTVHHNPVMPDDSPWLKFKDEMTKADNFDANQSDDED